MLAKGDKQRALLALRRKKYQETLLQKTDAQLEQLEKLTSSVEFALIQKDVFFGLQQGTKVLKEIHAEMGGLDHVEKMMGETAEEIAYQQVCLEIFSSSPLILLLKGAELLGMLNEWLANNDASQKTGSKRNVRRSHLQSRRRRSRRRVVGFGGRGGCEEPTGARTASTTSAATKCSRYRVIVTVKSGRRGEAAAATATTRGKTGHAGLTMEL